MLLELLNTAFTSDKTIENQNAVQKPATENPGTTFAASIINPAFITRENNPRVRSVIGKVINFTIGLINMFIIPRTTATMIEATRVTVAPGSKYDVIIIAIADTNKCVNDFIKIL